MRGPRATPSAPQSAGGKTSAMPRAAAWRAGRDGSLSFRIVPLHLELDWFRSQWRAHPRQLFIRRLAVTLDDAGRCADDGRVGRDIAIDDEGVRTDLGMVADPDRPEQDGIRPDEHVITRAWMPSATILARPAQRDIVEHDTVITDRRGLADHHARPVIEEEPPADRRGRMDLHAGPEARQHRHDPCNETQSEARVKPVSEAIVNDRVQWNMAQEHLGPAMGGRVVTSHGAEVIDHRAEHRPPPSNEKRSQRWVASARLTFESSAEPSVVG